MNLTNLFNLKYLIQNFKKSKALIILLTLVVPIFTSLLLLSAGENFVISFVELSSVNIFFMYIIPIVLSMTLFSYIYKKNSVDFIASMPLSRKTIYITNTIGGIALIIVMQLINMISTMLLSKILSSVVIFGSMVWDIFVFFTVAYIFVFAVSNLAMSFSGNKFSQIVAICLILFIIPFIIMSGDVLGDSYSYISVDESVHSSLYRDEAIIRIEEPYYFTAPSYIFDLLILDGNYEYSTQSVIKMSCLSIIYIIIGMIIFNRKKFELAGESYENQNIHLVIKMLTFAPFMFVFCSLNDSDKISVSLFFVAILAVYYFIFDLITNKKIKAKVSVVAFLISAIVVFAIYEGIIPKFGRKNIETVKISDVESINIDAIQTTWNSRCFFDLLVEDKALVDLILKSDENEYVYEYSYGSSFPYDAAISSTKTEIFADKEKDFYQSSRAELTMNLKNGKTKKYIKFIGADVYKKIIESLGEKEITNKFNNAIPIIETILLTDKEKSEILEIANKELSNIKYKELYGKYNSDTTEYNLRLYEYKNHRLIANRMNYKSFKDLHNKIANMYNQYTLNRLEEVRGFNIYECEDIIRKMLKENNPELLYVKKEDNIIIEDEELFGNIIYRLVDNMQEEIIGFIKEDSSKSVDINNDYIVISTYEPSYYYSNDVQKFYDIIIKAYNEKYQNIYD